MDLRLYLVITHLMVLDISQANVRLSLEDRVIELGKPLKLRCKITEPRQRRSRQWIGGEDNGLLCFNGVVSDPYKYKEIQEDSNTYVLQISNITESDLECPYACRYGFKSDQRILSINSTDIDFKVEKILESCNDDKIRDQDNNKFISAEVLPSYFFTVKRNKIYQLQPKKCFHYLELRLWKVFPVPSCGVKVKEDDERIPLSKLNKTRNGLVFDIIYRTQSTSPLYECGKPIRIECNTEHDSYNFFQPQPNECNVKIRSQTAFIVTCTTAIVCLFVTVVAVFCYIIWKKNSLKEKECLQTLFPDACPVEIQSDMNVLIQAKA